jgi:hypothetical protein
MLVHYSVIVGNSPTGVQAWSGVSNRGNPSLGGRTLERSVDPRAALPEKLLKFTLTPPDPPCILGKVLVGDNPAPPGDPAKTPEKLETIEF